MLRKYLEFKQNLHLTFRPFHPSGRRKQSLARDPACANRFSVRYITKTFVTNFLFANVLTASLGLWSACAAFTCKEKKRFSHENKTQNLKTRGRREVEEKINNTKRNNLKRISWDDRRLRCVFCFKAVYSLLLLRVFAPKKESVEGISCYGFYGLLRVFSCYS